MTNMNKFNAWFDRLALSRIILCRVRQMAEFFYTCLPAAPAYEGSGRDNADGKILTNGSQAFRPAEGPLKEGLSKILPELPYISELGPSRKAFFFTPVPS